MKYYRLPVLCFLTAALLASVLQAQLPADVPQDHWAYEAVQDLGSKGLIKGYPSTGKFLGNRSITRYEMASLILRVLSRVDDLIAKKAYKSDIAEASPLAMDVIKPEQLDEIRRLVDEYKTELAVIGTDLQKVQQEIGTLQTDVAELKDQINTNQVAIKGIQTDLSNVKKGVQGAQDAVKEQGARIDKVAAGKVDAGFGKIKITGAVQTWALLEKDAPNRGVNDTFKIRRATIRLMGSINPKAYWNIIIDPACPLALNTSTLGGNITSVTPNLTTTPLQEAYAGFFLTKNLQVEMGQQKVPLSMEGIRSSFQQFFAERSIFNVLPYNNGRVGNTYEIGLLFRYSQPSLDAQVGIFNDGGNRQNTTDDNNSKEILWHTQYKGIRYLSIGGSGIISGGVNGNLNTIRHRLGGEFSALYGKHRFEGEYMQARDAKLSGSSIANPRIPSHGGYLMYAYRMTPMWEFATRAEYWNPNRDAHGAGLANEYDLTLGVNYYLTGHNSKIQFNWIRKNINDTSGAATSILGMDRSLFLTQFQQAF